MDWSKYVMDVSVSPCLITLLPLVIGSYSPLEEKTVHVHRPLSAHAPQHGFQLASAFST
jgi:hypothetical protein